ncbi:MAG TPA: FprA family A-type flavoprotein, partial [Candidatus Atribacteria bacterium]|nr:FprA family A-type flavoprotein [Candidatus Atribacteria bacterium]
KLSGIQLKVVAPSHGLIWRGNPQQIVELYQKWADFQTTGGEEGITLLYGTMYGATEKATETFMQGLLKSEVPFEVFDVRKIHPSYILKALWQNRGVAVAVPTYETGLFPPLAHLLDLAKRKGITTKKVVYLGSFAWSGGAKRELEKWCVELGWEIIDTLEFKGNFTLKESQKIEELGTKFGKTIKQVFT